MSGSLAHETARRINRALHAHRTAAGDPYIADVDAARAASPSASATAPATRSPTAAGTTRQELPERGALQADPPRLRGPRPQERVAAVLGGRERVGAHEELILRAEAIRRRQGATAALGLAAGLDALLALPEGCRRQRTRSCTDGSRRPGRTQGPRETWCWAAGSPTRQALERGAAPAAATARVTAAQRSGASRRAAATTPAAPRRRRRRAGRPPRRRTASCPG